MTDQSFSPVFLDKCLDFTKHLTNMRTGKACIEIDLGKNARFYFSVDNSRDYRYSNLYKPNSFPPKKKSPSDLRRDAKRLEKFLDSRKKTSSSMHDSKLENPQKSADKTPMNVDSHVSETEAMETNDNASETKDKPDFQFVGKIPQMISPISSPEKIKSAKPENQSSTDDTLNKPTEIKPSTQTEEIKIMLCASNKNAASNVIKKFPLSSYIGPTNNKNHFVFSINFPPSQIKTLRKDSKKLIKPPQDVHIVNYHISKEEKTFYPGDKKHCPGCDIFY